MRIGAAVGVAAIGALLAFGLDERLGLGIPGNLVGGVLMIIGAVGLIAEGLTMSVGRPVGIASSSAPEGRGACAVVVDVAQDRVRS